MWNIREKSWSSFLFWNSEYFIFRPSLMTIMGFFNCGWSLRIFTSSASMEGTGGISPFDNLLRRCFLASGPLTALQIPTVEIICWWSSNFVKFYHACHFQLTIAGGMLWHYRSMPGQRPFERAHSEILQNCPCFWKIIVRGWFESVHVSG